MKKKVMTVLLSLVLLLGVSSTSTMASIPTNIKVTKAKKHHLVFDNETIQLANKVIKYDKHNELDCKSPMDLAETCAIIKEQSKYTHFDKYTVAAIVFQESKFKQDALNKKDGGTGLMQLTGIKKYHKDTLFWVRNPKDKHQNIIGGLTILEEMRRDHKGKDLAIKYFNGSTYRSTMYMQRIKRIKREMKAC